MVTLFMILGSLYTVAVDKNETITLADELYEEAQTTFNAGDYRNASILVNTAWDKYSSIWKYGGMSKCEFLNENINHKLGEMREASSYHNTSLSFYNKAYFENATYYADKSLTRYQNISRDKESAVVRKLMQDIQAGIGKKKEADSYYKTAVEYFKLDKLDNAKEKALEAKSKYEEINWTQGIDDCEELLQKINGEEGEYIMERHRGFIPMIISMAVIGVIALFLIIALAIVISKRKTKKLQTSITTKSLGDKIKPGRPLGVTGLVFFALVIVLSSFNSLLSFLDFSEELGLLLSGQFMFGSARVILLPVVFILLVALGFWRGSSWSWYLALFVGFMGALMQVVIPFFYLSFGIFNKYMIAKTAAFLLIYAVFFFYLFRSHVRNFFGVGRVGGGISDGGSEKIDYVMVACLVVAGFLLWFSPLDEVRVVDVIVDPENPQGGEEFTLIAELSGSGGLSLECMSYFAGGSVGGRGVSNVGDRHTKRFCEPDGTEIWCVYSSEGGFLADKTIQVGHVERSDISSLTISDVSVIPSNPSSDAGKIEVRAVVSSDVNISLVSFVRVVLRDSGSGSGTGKMDFVGDDTYSYTFYPHDINPFLLGTSGEKKFDSGTRVLYRIAAMDESGNTVVASGNFTIS